MRNRIVHNVTALVAVAALVAALGWLIHYKFSDCKKVGHSTFYCILDLSK